MGALRKLMPMTAATFIVGWLAIAGIPPFAGFWSKDDILINAWEKSPVLWAVGFVTAGLTAYYMSRQVFMVFFGEARHHADEGDEHAAHAAHESPWIMTAPLVVLAAAVDRRRRAQPAVRKLEFLDHWLEPVFAEGALHELDLVHRSQGRAAGAHHAAVRGRDRGRLPRLHPRTGAGGAARARDPGPGLAGGRGHLRLRRRPGRGRVRGDRGVRPHGGRRRGQRCRRRRPVQRAASSGSSRAATSATTPSASPSAPSSSPASSWAARERRRVPDPHGDDRRARGRRLVTVAVAAASPRADPARRRLSSAWSRARSRSPR